MSNDENLDKYHAAYSSNFKFYEENQWYLSHYAKRICRSIRERHLRSLLSLGIGHQVVSERLMREMDHSVEIYTILEGSLQIIDEFRKTYNLPEQVNVVHTYFEDFVAPEKYEAIEMGFILEHVDDPDLIVQRYQEMLKPGGTMFIAVPNARSLHRVIGHEAGLLDNVFQLSTQDHELGHKRYFDLNSICKLIEAAGLQITHKQGLMLKPVTGEQIQRLGWDERIIQALFKVGDEYPEIANCILVEATTQ